MTKPFNGTIFDLRNSYREIFPDKSFRIFTELEEEEIGSHEMHKIKYKINMLCGLDEYVIEDPLTGELSFGNEGVSILNLLCDQADEDI